MTNHGCNFDWCVNESDKWEVQRLEHFSEADFVPATGRSLNGYDKIHTAGVALHFSEDLEPVPTVTLSVQRGGDDEAELELRIDEAIVFYNSLGQAITNACKGTRLSPERITRFYSEDPQ